MTPLALALARQPGLWNADRSRTSFAGSPHGQADDILLRFEDLAGVDINAPDLNEQIDRAPRVWREAWGKLPEVRPIISALMARVGAFELARVTITRLSPGKVIAPHADTQGSYANSPEGARYHVVVQGEPGSLFHCGGETVNMRTGDVWWFNHREVHMVENNSAQDRIHLLIDLALMT